MKRTFKEIGGTSFHRSVIKASVEELKQILGEPEYHVNDGEGKINFEWEMECEDGDVFTVYDWKEYRPITETEQIEWHIGGLNRDVTEKAKKEIETML